MIKKQNKSPSCFGQQNLYTTNCACAPNLSVPSCAPPQSEAWLQSAIDFLILDSDLLPPWADVIAERGCKVCSGLLLFVSSSLRFTVAGRPFVSTAPGLFVSVG